jgi:CO/xanthine dehydrogenase FAD-binding subunit
MNRIEYLAPQSWSEASAMMADHPGAAPLAGGTDLLLQMKEKRRSAKTLLSLKRIPEAHHIHFEDGTLTLGSAVTAGQLVANDRTQYDFTALAMGAGVIGSIQIRNMATVGGNLCNAAPSADIAPPLLVFDARVVIANAQGERTISLESFFTGPGSTVLGASDLLTRIVVPQLPPHSGSYYLRHTPRAWMDIAVVGVAAAVTLAPDGTVIDARVALGAVAPTPLRAREAEDLLRDQSPTNKVLAEVGAMAAQEARPIDDLRASADYRRHLVNVLTQRAIRGALTLATQGGN